VSASANRSCQQLDRVAFLVPKVTSFVPVNTSPSRTRISFMYTDDTTVSQPDGIGSKMVLNTLTAFHWK
jgi:hypothetical protein